MTHTMTKCILFYYKDKNQIMTSTHCGYTDDIKRLTSATTTTSSEDDIPKELRSIVEESCMQITASLVAFYDQDEEAKKEEEEGPPRKCRIRRWSLTAEISNK